MATEVELEIAEDELRRLLAPWVVKEYPRQSQDWQAIRGKLTKRFRKKRFSRSFLGKLLSSKPKKASKYRTPDHVDEVYSGDWARYRLPDPAKTDAATKTVYLEWNDSGYETLVFARDRCHLLGISRIIEQLQPKSVLEIGAGPGINLIALSAVFPDIAFSGAELTATGVETAKSVQTSELPDVIELISPQPVKSRSAHQKIDFRQGDAQNLPFEDDSFDLVFTRLAVEQMEQIRDSALAEIRRVAKSHVVLVEPLRDFNRDPLQALATQVNNYISLEVSDLKRYGLEPLLQFSAWPHKITNGAGLVLCRKV